LSILGLSFSERQYRWRIFRCHLKISFHQNIIHLSLPTYCSPRVQIFIGYTTIIVLQIGVTCYYRTRRNEIKAKGRAILLRSFPASRAWHNSDKDSIGMCSHGVNSVIRATTGRCNWVRKKGRNVRHLKRAISAKYDTIETLLTETLD
jgi:hypothetical protein